jgi:hypothetical protein
VNHVAYLKCFRCGSFGNCVREKGLQSTCILQQGGAPAHCVPPVREYLSNTFSGRGFDIAWPRRSPDLTTCDNSLWGILKEETSQPWLIILQDLKRAIKDCFYDIQPLTWRKVFERIWKRNKQCTENGRQHTDLLRCH